MSKLAELLKGGAKLVSNVGEDYVLKLPQHLGGKEVNIPKHMLGLGNVETKGMEAATGIGKVVAPDMEKASQKGLGSVKVLDNTPENIGDIINLKRGENAAQALENKKSLSFLDNPMKLAAGAGAIPIGTDVSPLPKLQDILNKYSDVKETASKALARQLNLTGNKEDEANLATGIGIAADPSNLVPGAPGMALGAAEFLASLKRKPNQ